MTDTPKECPCPFCGGEPYVFSVWDFRSWRCGTNDYTKSFEGGRLIQSDRCRIRELESAALATDAQIADLQADLLDASMCIRRLLARVSRENPKLKMCDQINDWLKRKGLQGNILRTPSSGSAAEE